MFTKEPVKIAAVWHSLNHYCFKDAIFLAERLFAEGGEDVLYLLATCYYRAGHIRRAYGLLLKHGFASNVHLRYLFAKCCIDLNKISEAEAAITGTSNIIGKAADVIAEEFGSLSGVALQILGKIYMGTEQLSKAAECFRQSLKSNPFLWGSFEQLCQTVLQANQYQKKLKFAGGNRLVERRGTDDLIQKDPTTAANNAAYVMRLKKSSVSYKKAGKAGK